MTNKPKKTAKAKEPTQAQKISQLQTAVIQLYNLQERVIGMAEKMIASDNKGVDIMSLQSVLNKEQSAMNKHLQARCNSLYHGMIFCIMLVNVFGLLSVMRETGLYSIYTIVLGALTIGLWVGYYATVLFYWFRSKKTLPFCIGLSGFGEACSIKRKPDDINSPDQLHNQPEEIQVLFRRIHVIATTSNEKPPKRWVDTIRTQVKISQEPMEQCDIARAVVHHPQDLFELYYNGASIDQCINRTRNTKR